MGFIQNMVQGEKLPASVESGRDKNKKKVWECQMLRLAGLFFSLVFVIAPQTPSGQV
jgi:hypothetical protein